MSNFWDNFKSKLGAVAAFLIGIFAILFFVEKDKKESVEAELLNKDVNDKDKDLAAQQKTIEDNIKQVEAQGEAQKAKTPTEQDLVDFLNTNGE